MDEGQRLVRCAAQSDHRVPHVLIGGFFSHGNPSQVERQVLNQTSRQLFLILFQKQEERLLVNWIVLSQVSDVKVVCVWIVTGKP